MSHPIVTDNERKEYYLPPLWDGYQIAKRETSEGIRYYLQRYDDSSDGWYDYRGPYKQSGSVGAFLRRKYLRDVEAYRKLGYTIISEITPSGKTPDVQWRKDKE